MKMNIQEWSNLVTEELGWTDCFKKAVEELEQRGGGKLYVPAGDYRTYPIRLKSHMELYLERGAVLHFLDEHEKYGVIQSEYEGVMREMYAPCIYAVDEKDVAVTGSGTIDGHGANWWNKQWPYARPYMICFERCTHVQLKGVRLINSPGWTVRPAYCEDVHIQGISIKNPLDSPNTDGINPDCSRNVRISDCIIDVGDDCIALKAGTEESGKPSECENIVVTNCNMLHGHGGVVIGSEMSGGIRNLVVSNCVFQDTDRGIRLKTRRGRGGVIENLSFQNIVMDRVVCPLTFNMQYYSGPDRMIQYQRDRERQISAENTPVIRDIQINNITVHDAQAAAGYFCGLPESWIERVTISNAIISMDPYGKPGYPAMTGPMELMKGANFYLRFAKNIFFNNVTVRGAAFDEADIDDTVRLEWSS